MRGVSFQKLDIASSAPLTRIFVSYFSPKGERYNLPHTARPGRMITQSALRRKRTEADRHLTGSDSSMKSVTNQAAASACVPCFRQRLISHALCIAPHISVHMSIKPHTLGENELLSSF